MKFIFIKKESKRISSHIKDLLNDQNKYQLKIEKYKKAMDIIQSKNYVFYEVIGTFEFRVDKNKKYNAIGMNVVKFLNDDEKTEKWSISEFDLGTLSKYKRFDTALRGMMFGQFKSPYMMSSLENPNIPVRVLKKAKSKILLNTLQRKAVNVSLNSHFASYLQGPPGTGKTQCISVIIENFAKENEISLISSSTNEAINNVFDRVKNDNIDPNLIYLRQTSSNENKKKVLNYSEEFMTFNIIDQMDNFVLKKSKSGNQELIQKFIKEYPMENGKPIKYITQLVKKKYNYLDPIEANIKKISKFLGESEERLHNMDSRHIHEEVQWEINKIIRKAKRFYGEYFDSLEEFLRQNDIKYDLNDSILEVLKVHISEPKTSKFFKAIKELNSQTFQENIFKSKFDLKTREIIAENKMVNIIGITTTARMVIKISDKKFDLFSQYPVNFAVIDEVSKSITPEILAISMLSDRFLYSGDYRQLPPFMDLDDRIIKKYLSYLIENYEGEETQDWDIKHIQKIFETSEMDVDLVEKTKQLDSSKIQEDEDFDSMFVKLKTHLEKLYGNSIFANQVESMKASPKLSTSSYTALTHQYRFCEEINKIVNIFYEKKEALVTSSQNFNRIFVGKNKDHSPVQIIDTSYITKDFASKVKDKIIVEGMTSFDQVESLFSSYIGNSRFNEFNIHTIEKLLLDIKANNPKIQNEDIGVISMTRTQANLTNQKLLPNPTLKGIKIDTVDNFQGRQKDLIIVDLVLGQSKYISKGKMQTGKRNTSFYKNPERLNVAISRAKSKLILVGAFEDYIAENIISDIKNNGNVRSIKVFKKWKEMIEGWNDDN